MRVYIYHHVVEGILEGAKRNYPNEFFCLLGGKRERENVFIDEIIYIPHKQSRRGVVYDLLAIPVADRIVGSAHSHPFSPKWSLADLRSFPHTGEVHLIVVPPFTEESIYFYDVKGNLLEHKIIYGQRASF